MLRCMTMAGIVNGKIGLLPILHSRGESFSRLSDHRSGLIMYLGLQGTSRENMGAENEYASKKFIEQGIVFAG